jgi:hypothetical protein
MRFAVLLPVALLLLSPAVASGLSKTGTTIGQFLLIEPSARIAAMGNVGVSVCDGIQSVYYNPGALGRFHERTVQLSHSEWFAGIDYEYAAIAVPVSNYGNVFGSVTALNSGDIDVRTVEKPLGTGERYTVSDIALSLGFGRAFSDRFAAGAQINYVAETIWHTTLKTWTLNVGGVYRLTEQGLQLGSSISNYGASAGFSGRDLAMQYDNDPDRYGDNSALPGEKYTGDFSVPVLFRVGLSMPRRISSSSELLMAVNAFHPSDNNESVSLGAEWGWKETLFLRGGYQNLFLSDSEVGLTLGLGMKGKIGSGNFGFDYGWADHGRLQETHRITFVVGL